MDMGLDAVGTGSIVGKSHVQSSAQVATVYGDRVSVVGGVLDVRDEQHSSVSESVNSSIVSHVTR